MKFRALLTGLFRDRRIPKLSRPELLQLQQERLRTLLRFAYENSEFYHRTFTAAGITSENIDTLPLEAFPTTDKHAIIENYPQVLTDEGFTQDDLKAFCESGKQGLFRDRWHVVHSSGSTERPVYFVYSQDDWNELILGAARGALWGISMDSIVQMGISQVHLLYAGVSQGSFGSTLLVSEACSTINAQQLSLDISEPLECWADKVIEFRPNIIMGYPSAIKILADQLHKRDIHLSVQLILSCGEGLSEAMRKSLSNDFHAPIINFYAASESLAIGVETNFEEGMYLYDDLNVIECIDGKMYLTSLYNYGQPIIRYYLSDMLELLPYDETKPPKYSFTRCRLHCGRQDDVLWFKDDAGKQNFIHAVHVENFCIPALLEYQLVQTSDSSFRIDAVIDSARDADTVLEELRQMTSELLAQRNLSQVTFELRQTDLIPADVSSGKHRLCVALPETDNSDI